MRCCQCFCVVHSVYSSVYWTTQRHWQHRLHKTQDKINTRVNRRYNQEWTTQSHWQHRIHKTQSLVFILSCVLCIRCCQCLCVVHSWLSLLFTLVFILSCVLCIRCCQCLCVVHNTRVNRRYNQEWKTQRHWQHRIHKTQDTINTRVNRRNNTETLCFLCLVCPMLSVSLCYSFLIVPSVYSSVYLSCVCDVVNVSLFIGYTRQNKH
jgi:hypothetical protein